jgi:hypothetical protein
MIIRVAFFILMSLGLIGFGAVAWITTRPMSLGGAPPTKMILVAAQAIQGGSLLTSDDLQQKEIPSTRWSKSTTPTPRRFAAA